MNNAVWDVDDRLGNTNLPRVQISCSEYCPTYQEPDHTSDYADMDCWASLYSVVNDWNGNMDAYYDEYIFFNGIYSAHDNTKQDRRFIFSYCKPLGVTSYPSVSTTHHNIFSASSITPIRNNLLTTIDIGDSMTFIMDITIYSFPNTWSNIFSVGNINVGQRFPGIYLLNNAQGFHICMTNTQNSNDCDDVQVNGNLQLNTKYTVKIEYTQSSYTVSINDVEYIQDTNYPTHTTPANVKVYAGDPWYPSANVLIENFKIQVPSSTAGSIYLPITNYDEEWERGCGGNAALSRAQSHWSSTTNDRQWTFRCTPLTSNYRMIDCQWTEYVNEWEGIMNYNCPNDGLLRTVQSIHDNTKEDRRFRFECCRVIENSYSYPAMTSIKDINFVAAWQHTFDNRQNAYFLCGQESEHSNQYEDRAFKWKKCKPATGSGAFIEATYNVAVTESDNEWSRSCGCINNGNAAMTGVLSSFDHTIIPFRDRLFTFQCGRLVTKYKLVSCGWTGYLNNWDGILDFDCPNDGVIRSYVPVSYALTCFMCTLFICTYLGIWSRHDNYRQDRLWKFECCQVAESGLLLRIRHNLLSSCDSVF